MSLRMTLVLLALFNLSNANVLDELFSTRNNNNIKSNHIKAYGKQGTPFIVKSETDILNFSAGHMRVITQIQSQSVFSEVRYKWILPPGVELSWGTTEGMLYNLGSEEFANLEIEIRGLNLNTNENVILFLERNSGEQELGASFVIASRKDLTEEFKKMPDVEEGQEQLKKMSFDDANVSKQKKFIY